MASASKPDSADVAYKERTRQIREYLWHFKANLALKEVYDEFMDEFRKARNYPLIKPLMNPEIKGIKEITPYHESDRGDGLLKTVLL